jgi:hypothetical protein
VLVVSVSVAATFFSSLENYQTAALRSPEFPNPA